MGQTSLHNTHVAIIMDGNGRWAKKRGLPRPFGHKEGVATVKKTVTYCAKKGLGFLSMFAFSMENWLRPAEEVSLLMNLLDDYVVSERTLIMENNIRFVISGRAEMVPDRTRQKLENLAAESVNNKGMVLNLVISYGGRNEICDAARLVAIDLKNGVINENQIDSEFIASKLYNPEIPDIDLLIRTSGEHRISNFMLWRLAYAELYFTEILWPDFSEKDFDDALDDFSKRIRRFGKTDEQMKN